MIYSSEICLSKAATMISIWPKSSPSNNSTYTTLRSSEGSTNPAVPLYRKKTEST